MTTDSPCVAGRQLTRISNDCPATRMLMRPSVGRRFSAMSIPAMIFTREMIGPCSFFGGESISWQLPSTRYRTRSLVFIGSMWISLARIFTASLMSSVTRRIMAESSPSSSVVSTAAWMPRSLSVNSASMLSTVDSSMP